MAITVNDYAIKNTIKSVFDTYVNLDKMFECSGFVFLYFDGGGDGGLSESISSPIKFPFVFFGCGVVSLDIQKVKRKKKIYSKIGAIKNRDQNHLEKHEYIM